MRSINHAILVELLFMHFDNKPTQVVELCTRMRELGANGNSRQAISYIVQTLFREGYVTEVLGERYPRYKLTGKGITLARRNYQLYRRVWEYYRE